MRRFGERERPLRRDRDRERRRRRFLGDRERERDDDFDRAARRFFGERDRERDDDDERDREGDLRRLRPRDRERDRFFLASFLLASAFLSSEELLFGERDRDRRFW